MVTGSCTPLSPFARWLRLPRLATIVRPFGWGRARLCRIRPDSQAVSSQDLVPYGTTELTGAIVKSRDFFVERAVEATEEDLLADPWASLRVVTELDEELLVSLRRGPLDGRDDVQVAVALLDLVREELEEFGTAGDVVLTNPQVENAIRALEAVTRRVGVDLKVPFRDFSRFRSYWLRNDAYGSWEARRRILDELFERPRERLIELDDSRFDPILPERSLAHLRDPAAIREHLQRIRRAIADDPAQVVGSAKDLVESTAKIVLQARGLPVDDKAKFPTLVKSAQQALSLHSSSLTTGPDGDNSVKQILGAASSMAHGLAELRNRYGTGHGPVGARVGLSTRHAHLAVNAATTWCQLMLETLADEQAPWREEEVQREGVGRS